MAETTETVEQKQDRQTDATQPDSKTKVQAAEFSEVTPTDNEQTRGSIEILLDMGVLVTVAIGTAQIPVRRLLQLGPGSVLKLDKPVDAPVDLYLKNTRFATGTVVIVDGQFAVRIKQILGLGSPAEQVPET